MLRRGQEEWDRLLLQIMRAFRGTPHSTTGETANLMMLGRELRLPDQLSNCPPPMEQQFRQEYVQATQSRLAEAHDILKEELFFLGQHCQLTY